MTRKEQKYDAFRQLCRDRGYKCTRQRFAVYSFMKENRKHPDVDQVWNHVRKELPSITRESVFRILNELADSGVAYRLDQIIHARFDGQSRSHGHLICGKCGAIADFELPDSLPSNPALAGFTANHVELRICGLCGKCANQQHGGAITRKK